MMYLDLERTSVTNNSKKYLPGWTDHDNRLRKKYTMLTYLLACYFLFCFDYSEWHFRTAQYTVSVRQIWVSKRTHTMLQINKNKKIHILGVRRKCRWIN